jgi:flagella synthesis protein FlgN
MATASPTSILRDEQQLMSSLLELIKQEQQCLVKADSDALDAITPQKSMLVKQLAQLAGQRHQALGAAGFAAREAGMEDWLAGCKDADAHALWPALLDLTREAKELNRVNGLLINKHMSHNQGVINAMRTPTGGFEPAVYGPSGQTTTVGPSRRFVVG